LSVKFSEEEKYLLVLIKAALSGGQAIGAEKPVNINMVLEIAQKHSVLSILYDELQQMSVTEEQQILVDKYCRQITLQNYRLLFLTKYLLELLQQNQIPSLVLKGVATASWYPVPELRKSGDVDLLIPKQVKMEKVGEVLKASGFVEKMQQHANYHMEFLSSEGITVEIHTEFTERFAYKKINAAMEKQVQEGFASGIIANAMGVELPVLNRAYHAYELILHMLHHFTTSGFGLKLLCDWVVCWKQEWTHTEKECFYQLTEESATRRFAEAVTEVCVAYLGMKRENFAWEYDATRIPGRELMREILDAEEFGENDTNRMVMMSGMGPGAYMKELHHQMHLNFPKAGKCFLLWPGLWVITLVRFLRNNKRVRNTSTKEVLQEAKRRSRLMKELRLFQ